MKKTIEQHEEYYLHIPKSVFAFLFWFCMLALCFWSLYTLSEIMPNIEGLAIFGYILVLLSYGLMRSGAW